jgi:phosphate transport system permease protein
MNSALNSPEMERRVAQRYRAERRFRMIGLAAISLSLLFLAFLLFTILRDGLGGIDWAFLTGSDSTDAATAGVWGAVKGSFLTMAVTLALSFPMGVLSSIYLEEFAPRSRWVGLVEVSINNLAAVPSIIFGLLGLAVFINTLNMPRSSPLVGGLTLALMTMPVIIISGRNAIKAVPPSIRDAALAVGASRVQTVFHHVLPLALPGILTGTIIGMARALGETAPLLMIGMRAFVSTPPGSVTDPASVLPMQIFLWSDEIDKAFVQNTSAAIIVLLIFLLAMNGIAIYLRNRFENRW